ncbi:Valine-tRNA ligase, mitochondrial [Zancudomyces culisetae]|uniref:Probable valine--tRNA ligase, cytoplasmic n=1 Tax=Zancudomyces culisetae TaxID=1213189 RepID=A0A1R1PFF3_ZANCU|nr:Valine-tRNA ligase, mitochondrial [Zancudomyces culisetae]|eukprot:OMH79735.1 Valine-tRNA ligase, mitochondrial [Zancudomyces culisetae]
MEPTPEQQEGQQPQVAKSKNQEKNEAKRKAKMEKFLAKQNKATQQSGEKTTKKKEEATKKKVKDTPSSTPAPAVQRPATVPGEKKDMTHPMAESYSPRDVESGWYDWWVKEKYFEPKFTESGEVKPEGKFVIVIPPPNVTGKLHIGHALGMSIQDSLIRWNRMKGLTTLFNPGTDHAGISTQSVVEKQLLRNEGKSRHDLGREKFVERVWEWKELYKEEITQQIKRLGGSFDWSREKFTLDEGLSRAVAETFVRLWDEGTIYRAKRLVNWCVHLNTALSNLEVENVELSGRTLRSVPGYKDKVEFGVLVLFSYPIVGSDERITVATTRIETMLGDVAIAVHPEDARYKHLIGKEVQHPFVDRKLPIIADADLVDMEFGTGAVKITPAHDFNDYLVGVKHKLPIVNVLNDDGTFNGRVRSMFAGKKRFDVRREIVEELKKVGLYVEHRDNAMKIPICAKSGDVIEPLVKPQWYVKCAELAKPAIEAVRNGELEIVPKASEGEWFRWLEGIQDWCVSRQLWWGHRIPAYYIRFEDDECDYHDDQSRWVCGRTLEEAQERATKLFGDKKFALEQDPDVLDTWFSSGLWPFSVSGWPEQTEDLARLYPTTLLETGWDILFFWVARMVMLGLRLTGKLPFKQVFCHAMIRDAHGRKMSKSLGNVIDPLDVIQGISLEELHQKLESGNLDPRELKTAIAGQKKDFPNGIPECGTDALRFALCAYTSTGRDLNLDVLRIEGYRKFCNKLWNAVRFSLLKFSAAPDFPAFSCDAVNQNQNQKSPLELWILHCLHSATQSLNQALADKNFMAATNVIYSFWLYELCDVYLEFVKHISDPTLLASCLSTLHYCLDVGLRLLHPFMPFITEELWQRLPNRDSSFSSITIAPYPTESSLINPAAKSDFDLVIQAIKTSRSMMLTYSVPTNASIYIAPELSSHHSLFALYSHPISKLIKGCSSLSPLLPSAQPPSGCAISLISSPSSNSHIKVALLVKGLVDIDAQVSKLQSKLDNFSSQHSSLSAKITDPTYILKSADSVKAANLDKLSSLSKQIDSLSELIAEFKAL